jgi:hypothetical protein
MTAASTLPFPNLSFPLIRMNRSTSYSQPLMRTPARILILLTALSLHNFAGADLARKFYKAQIGFAKMDVRPTNSSTILNESGLSLGIEGKFAFFDNPDKFSLDFDYGYKYRAISPAKMHRFGVALTPALHVHEFFTPYAPLGFGYHSFSPEDSGFYFSPGIGAESAWTNQFSTRISYQWTLGGLYEQGELGIGTSYWFEEVWGIGLDLGFLSGQRSMKGVDVSFSIGTHF